MADKEEKEKEILDQVERANLIKTIAQEYGFVNANDLKIKLKKYYDVDIHIDTLYTDLKRIEMFSKEDLRAFENKVLANCEAHLQNLNTMSTKAKYEQYRIKAIDSYFKNVPEMLKMLKSCRQRAPVKTEEPKEEQQEEEGVDIKFGD